MPMSKKVEDAVWRYREAYARYLKLANAAEERRTECDKLRSEADEAEAAANRAERELKKIVREEITGKDER